jgi:hypothetical protein
MMQTVKVDTAKLIAIRDALRKSPPRWVRLRRVCGAVAVAAGLAAYGLAGLSGACVPLALVGVGCAGLWAALEG